jgi:DNA-binding NarL/FixJ family response regulator
MKNVSVLIVDDHTLFRDSLANVIADFSFVGQVRKAINGKEAIKEVRKKIPDLILMDIHMPDMDGAECSEILIKRYPDIKIIALTGAENAREVVKMIELGVQGYCLKNIELEELEKACISVLKNDFYQNSLIVEIMRNEIISHKTYDIKVPETSITKRERQLLKLICQERTAASIAETLCLSPRTIEKIRTDLAKKLGVKGVVGLVRYAVRHGFDLYENKVTTNS